LYTNLLVSLLRDDGGVVYLNGTEILRSNISPLPAFDTLALNAPDDGTIPDFARVSTAALRNGTNVVAAEVHQATRNSSDLGFDLELIGLTRGPNRPQLSIARSGTNVVLSWPANFSGFTLESSTSLGGTWSTAAGTTGIQNGEYRQTNLVTGSTWFFRLQD
jgi:hypothetical protein